MAKEKINDEKLTIEMMTKKNDDNTPIDFEDGESVNDKVSLMAIKELLDSKKIKTNSRIKFEQVPILTKLLLFDDIFETGFTSKLADYILHLQVSISGLGRKELVSLVQQRDMTSEEKPALTSKNIFK